MASLAGIRSTFAEELDKIEPESGRVKDLYMLGEGVTYFNHGSIGTVPKAVHEAHIAYLKLCETNPWLYMWREPWKEQREVVRERLAKFVGCNAQELVLTHNTTEGMNMLAAGLPLKAGDEVLFSSFNHSGASVCWQHHGVRNGYSARSFEFKEEQWQTEDAVVAAYESEIKPNTRVLVLPHVDNIIGVEHPLKKITRMAKRKGVEYVAVDGAQAVGMLDVNFHDLEVDFYCNSPHKWIQAPKGTGLLYIKKGLEKDVHPMIVTWGQKSWEGDVKVFEDYGTRNLPELMSIGDALDFHGKVGFKKSMKKRTALRQYFKTKTEDNPKTTWKSPEGYGETGSLFAIEVEGWKANALAKHLYENHGYVFRPFQSKGRNTIRLSLNFNNTESQIDQFFKLIS